MWPASPCTFAAWLHGRVMVPSWRKVCRVLICLTDWRPGLLHLLAGLSSQRFKCRRRNVSSTASTPCYTSTSSSSSSKVNSHPMQPAAGVAPEPLPNQWMTCTMVGVLLLCTLLGHGRQSSWQHSGSCWPLLRGRSGQNRSWLGWVLLGGVAQVGTCVCGCVCGCGCGCGCGCVPQLLADRC